MRPIKVGILAAPEIRFTLHGRYACDGKEVAEGSYTATSSGATYEPLTPDSTFELHDVVIGIGFHWERKETQRFEGALSIVAEGDGLRAINIIDIERYLISVISSEMSALSPVELLKAHAVISRSWLMAQVLGKGECDTAAAGMYEHDDEVCRWFDREDHEGFDVCADDHCQRYQGITRASLPIVAEAVMATCGEVLRSAEDDICDARFSKCCGGVTELFENCWGDSRHSYLVALRDDEKEQPVPALSDEASARRWITERPRSFCDTRDPAILSVVLNSYDRETPDFYRWSVTYTATELAELIERRSGIDFGRIRALEPVRRGPSARIVSLRIVGEKRTVIVGKELMIRRWLSESHLFSSAFVVDAGEADTDGFPATFTLRGAGWGHGVGLCQVGAAVMAVKGYGYREILTHYFPSATVEK